MVRSRRGCLACMLVAATLATIGCAARGPGTSAPPPQPPRLHVVRHAEAWLNLPEADRPAGLVGDQLEGLTPRGRAQAVDAADRLRATPTHVVLVYSSPADRAYDTARIIAQRLGVLLAVRTDARWAKMTPGETVDQAGRRALDAAGDALTAMGSDQAAVVVSHGDVIPALIGEILGTPGDERFDRHGVAKGSITTLWLDRQGRWRLAMPGEAGAP